MEQTNIHLEGKNIYLRTLKKDDASNKYCSWINDREVNKYLETKKTNLRDLRKYIYEKFSDPNCIFLGIFLKKNNEHIGNIKLEPIDLQNNSATLGIIIGEKSMWNKGYATEAMKLILEYSFNILKLDSIKLGVYKDNKSAIRLYKKCGFEIYKEDKNTYKMRIKRFRMYK